VTDLQTLRPDLAAELVDPANALHTVMSAVVVLWRCANHDEPYQQRISHRSSGSGCPYCAGRAVLKGFNDFATTHPDLAVELWEVDPATIAAGSTKKVRWRCPKHREPYWSTPVNRVRGLNCGVCRGKTVAPRVNDLATTHPDIASDLVEVDASTITAKSTKKLQWMCREHGGLFSASPRARVQGILCGVCAGKEVVKGVNDLATTHPELARELVGTDPTTVFASTMKTLFWACPQHEQPYPSSGSNRVKGQGCGYCTNKRVLPGFNDLASTHPSLAAELIDEDATTITAGSGRRLMWLCSFHGEYAQVVRKRAAGQGCPSCAPYGFDPGRPAWMYLAIRTGEQQVGITRDLDRREKEHGRSGWVVTDVRGPVPGREILGWETAIKSWLRAAVPLLPGSLERWSTANLEVASLAELLSLAMSNGVPVAPVASSEKSGNAPTSA
jgi:hypothetical protein